MPKRVYDFEEGNRSLTALLGGKGANLSEMTRIGMPVPHGFTITTGACKEYLATGDFPAGLMEEVEEPPLAPLWVTLAVVLAVDPEDALNPMVRCSGPASLQKWVSPRLQNLQRQFQSGVSPSSRKRL